MRQWPQNIEQILNNSTSFIYFDDSAIIFKYQQQNCMFATIRAILSLSLHQIR